MNPESLCMLKQRTKHCTIQETRDGRIEFESLERRNAAATVRMRAAKSDRDPCVYANV